MASGPFSVDVTGWSISRLLQGMQLELVVPFFFPFVCFVVFLPFLKLYPLISNLSLGGQHCSHCQFFEGGWDSVCLCAIKL